MSRSGPVAVALRENSPLVQSRKRKLRELYAVAQYANHGRPIQPNFDSSSTTPTDAAENRFLENNNIVQLRRPFDEKTLPPRSLDPNVAIGTPVKKEDGLLSAESTVTRSRSPLRRFADATTAANSPLARLDSHGNLTATPRLLQPTNGVSTGSSPAKQAAAFAGSLGGRDKNRSLNDRQLTNLNLANGDTTSVQHAKTPVTPSLSSANSLPTPTPSTATSHAPLTALLPPGDLDDLPASPGSSIAEDSKSTTSSQEHAATSTSSVEDGHTPTLSRHFVTTEKRPHGAPISPEEESTDKRVQRSARHDVPRSKGDAMDVDDEDEVIDGPSPTEVNADGSLMEIDEDDVNRTQAEASDRTSKQKLTLSTTDLKTQEHGGQIGETSGTAAAGGRMRSASTSKSGPPPTPTERRMTRVASGAMRHKSVSEILGEPLKPSTSPTTSERATPDGVKTTGAEPSLSPLLAQQKYNELRDKSKLSSVLFARNGPHAMQRSGSRNASQHKNPARDPIAENRDYFEVLFEAQASSHPLDALLATAHKAVSTDNHYVNLHEMQDMRILRRIHSMQTTGRWSFRQIERAVEPPRKAAHWDMLLDEMKWMRTDFREERKWKMVVAKLLADACASWVSASPAERINLQVRVAFDKPVAHSEPEDSKDVPDASDQPTPGLTHSADGDSVRDLEELPETTYDSVAPAAIFSLPGDEVVFEMQETPSSKDMLDNLPLYEPFRIAKASDADADWRTAAVPVSKYVHGKMLVKEPEPPKKRSRFNYDEDQDYQEAPTKKTKLEEGESNELSRKDSLPLPSEQHDVALFNPKYQQIRDRYRSLHSYKIPSDSMMPPVQFFEHRAPSQWTWTEDEELKRLAREYGYNWPIIADSISNKSEYSSGAERRTPWECFERWVSLEGLPPDMQRTALLRTFYARLDVPAKGNAAQMLQASQFTAVGGNEGMMRRRNTQSFRVDKRKNNRHMAMFEAMRKLAKKRETQLQKQQQAAGIAAMRKVVEPQLSRRPNPLEYSRRKFEREQQIEARLKEQSPAVYQQLLAQQQRASLLQRAQASQANGANGRPTQITNGNGQQSTGAGSPVLGAASSANPAQARPSSAQGQPGSSTGAPVNQSPVSAVSSLDDQLKNGKRATPVGAIPFNSLPANSLQSPANFDRTKLQLHLQLENQRIQMQQRNLQQQQKAQANVQAQINGNQTHPGSQSPQSLNAMNMTAFSNNPALFNAAMQQQLAANAAALQNSMNGGANGSPTMANRALYQSQLAATNQQQLNINRLMQVTKSLKQRFPHATPANINAMAQRTISDMAQARMNQALSSASGSGGSPQLTPQQLALINGNAAQLAAAAAAGGAGGNGSANPQAQAQYLFRLQQQQAQQAQRVAAAQAAAAAASNGGLSRSGTPQNASSSSPRISQGQGQSQGQGIQANSSPS